jgi:HPr kinase/phosphorylase
MIDIPLLRTELSFSSFINDLIYCSDGKLAHSINIHRVTTSVCGLGVLIVGKSVIGKLDFTLEFVKNGVRLLMTYHKREKIFRTNFSRKQCGN